MIYENIVDTIGKTPMVKLRSTDEDMADIYVKLESFNPSGSIKDRASLYMILDAEKSGLLKKGGTIVEPTSGNTGIGLAMIGASLGYKVILVMPETMSVERRNLIKAYGAEIILTEGSKGMKGAVDKADELVEEFGYFKPNQFGNENNKKAHYETTAVEILEDLENIDGFVAGVGTGGTVSGVGKRLKEELDDVYIVAVQPKKSPVLTGGNGGPHGIQGIGANFVPDIYDFDVVDEVYDMEDEDALSESRNIARTEGILVGISAGGNIKAAKLLAKKLGKGKKVVTVLPDTGERYLSTKLFSEE